VKVKTADSGEESPQALDLFTTVNLGNYGSLRVGLSPYDGPFLAGSAVWQLQRWQTG